jgi:hypothetical protein
MERMNKRSERSSRSSASALNLLTKLKTTNGNETFGQLDEIVKDPEDK